MLDTIKKRWSELDKSIVWFLGSAIIMLVRRCFLLGIDKTYQCFLIGVGFIMLLISICRVVFQRSQIWRDVSDVPKFVERIAIRLAFYLLATIYIYDFIITITEIGANDAKELWIGICRIMVMWMILNIIIDFLNLVVKQILPWMPYVSITSFLMVLYFLSLLTESTTFNLIFVVFGKMFVDMVFSNDFIFKKYFSEGTDSSPFKRLIRIKYRLYTLISSIVLVQAMRLMVPNEIKSLFRSLLYGNTEFWNRVTLSFFMMGTTIVVFLILDIIVTDAMGELLISRYGSIYKSYSTLNRKYKRILWGVIILVPPCVITIIFFDKLREVLEKRICDFQVNPLIIGAITFLAMAILLTFLLFLLKSSVQNYKKAKTKLRHYLISGAISENQEQNLS